MGSDGGFFQRKGDATSEEGGQQVPRINIIEAVESYTSEHPETIQEFLSFPWRKAEALYESHIKRNAVRSAELVKNAMISGIWSNTNLDDGKQTRKMLLEEVEENYQRAINIIYNNEDSEYISDQELEEDPFFAAIKLAPLPETENQEDSPLPTAITREELQELDQF